MKFSNKFELTSKRFCKCWKLFLDTERMITPTSGSHSLSHTIRGAPDQFFHVVALWCEVRKVVFINQCRANTRLNDDESQCDEADTSDFKATGGESTLTSLQHFCIRLAVHCAGRAAQELARARATHAHTHGKQETGKQTDTQAHKHPSISFLSPPCPVSPAWLFPPPFLLSHTNTQPLRWGNWMWQQILRGLLAGYQVNLWNITHLTPAGWLWHLQQKWLNHSSRDSRVNTVGSFSSADVFSLGPSSP